MDAIDSKKLEARDETALRELFDSLNPRLVAYARALARSAHREGYGKCHNRLLHHQEPVYSPLATSTGIRLLQNTAGACRLHLIFTQPSASVASQVSFARDLQETASDARRSAE